MAISEKKVITELQWYYNSAHAELGIISSYGNMIASAFGFAPNNCTNYTEDKLIGIVSNQKQPIRKLRKIETTLRHIPKQQRRILDALYGNHTFPPQLTSMFGNKTGSALFNDKITNLPSLISLCAKKLSKQHLTNEEKQTLKVIEEQKDKLYQEAHHVYWLERNKHD